MTFCILIQYYMFKLLKSQYNSIGLVFLLFQIRMMMWVKIMAYFVHPGIFYSLIIILSSQQVTIDQHLFWFVAFSLSFIFLSFHIHLIRFHHLCSFCLEIKTLVHIHLIYSRMKLKCRATTTQKILWF